MALESESAWAWLSELVRASGLARASKLDWGSARTSELDSPSAWAMGSELVSRSALEWESELESESESELESGSRVARSRTRAR